MLSVADLSESLGVPIPGVKLLLSVLISYLISIFHHKFVHKYSPKIQHYYFIISSSVLYYWNYGIDIQHAYLCVVVQWILINSLNGSLLCAVISFIFQMTYLILGYYSFTSDDYDINWLMPHCVLTLRLIGLCFDVYDGHKDEKHVTKEQEERKISDLPGLIEVLAFSFFPTGFLVGPQFPLSQVRLLVEGNLVRKDEKSSKRYVEAAKQLFLGIFFLLLQTVVSSTYNEGFYTTPGFSKLSLIERSLFVAITGYFTLLRYITVWMINEGSCIIIGIGYNYDVTKKVGKWDGVRNAHIWNFLFCCNFQGLIDCFNINTNNWVARYVFKRMRWAGNRLISQFATLFFLAVWHGVHAGYFTCFAYEFLLMSAERPFRNMMESTSLVSSMRKNSILKYIPSLVGFCYFHLLCGYCIIDFVLLKWHRYKPVYDALYWQGHVFFMVMLAITKITNILSKKKKNE